MHRSVKTSKFLHHIKYSFDGSSVLKLKSSMRKSWFVVPCSLWINGRHPLFRLGNANLKLQSLVSFSVQVIADDLLNFGNLNNSNYEYITGTMKYFSVFLKK